MFLTKDLFDHNLFDRKSLKPAHFLTHHIFLTKFFWPTPFWPKSVLTTKKKNFQNFFVPPNLLFYQKLCNQNIFLIKITLFDQEFSYPISFKKYIWLKELISQKTLFEQTFINKEVNLTLIKLTVLKCCWNWGILNKIVCYKMRLSYVKLRAQFSKVQGEGGNYQL